MVSVLCLPLQAQTVYWHFEDAESLKAEGIRWLSVKEQVELVPGYKGKALRTDGYSTYLEAEWPEGARAVSAWFALESFPTDTAAFVSVRNEKGDSRSGNIDIQLLLHLSLHMFPGLPRDHRKDHDLFPAFHAEIIQHLAARRPVSQRQQHHRIVI